MILSAPEDRSVPNGPSYAKGDPVDTVELAAAIGHPDPDVLAADLVEQGWSEAKKPAKTAAAKKKAADKTAPDEGDDNKET